MKKHKKLAIKKVTLRNLDDPTLGAMAGGEGSKRCTDRTCATDCTEGVLTMSCCVCTKAHTCKNTCPHNKCG